MAEGEGSSAFNPSQPVQQDYPYFWSKPTQQPKPDLSGEIKGKAIGEFLHVGGEALHEGVQGITAAYEKGIQNTIYNAVDPMRDAYMSRLHEVDQSLKGRATPDPTGNIFSDYRDQTSGQPSEIKQLPQQLDTLDSAKDNGKLSQTDYDARLNSLAKDIRAKYPGYRQYVDEEFKRITGRDSANQYIKSVIQDIDSYTSARKGAGSKVESRMLEAGLKYGQEGVMWWQKVQQDPDKYSVPALQWLASRENADHSLDIATKQVDFLKATDQYTKEKDATTTNQGLNDYFSHRVPSALDSAFTHYGVDPINQANQEYLNKVRRGETVPELPEEQRVMMRTSLQSQRASLASEMASDIANRFPNMKHDEIYKAVEDDLKLHWDPVMESLGKGDYSQAAFNKNMITAEGKDRLNALYKNDGATKATMGFVQALRDNGDTELANQIMIAQGQQVSNAVGAEVAKAGAAAAAPTSSQLSKQFGEIAADLKAKNIHDGNAWRSVFDIYTTVGNKGPDAISDEAADALIKSAFGPKSDTVLQNFEHDNHWDVGRGSINRTLGRQWAFQTLTSDGMLDRIAKRAKEHPEYYTALKRWSGNAVLDTLDHEAVVSQSPRYLGVKVAYDDATQTFHFKEPEVKGVHGTHPEADPTRTRALKDISDNMHRIAEIERRDPNLKNGDGTKAIWQVLQAQAARLGPGIEGTLLENMIKAVKATRPQ